MPWLLQQSFANGELDPEIFGLSDAQAYNSGARAMANAMVTRYGSVFKRWGDRFIANSTGNGAAKLIPFIVRGQGPFMLVFTNLNLDVYDATTESLVFNSVTPYTSAETFELQYAQDDESMFLAHKDHAPREVLRTGLSGSVFKIRIVDFRSTGPVLDNKVNDIAMTKVSDTEVTTASNFFLQQDVGGFFRIGQGYFVVQDVVSPTEVTVSMFDLTVANGHETTDWDGPFVKQFENAQAGNVNIPNAGTTTAGDTVTIAGTGTFPDFADTDHGVLLDIDGANSGQRIVHLYNRLNSSQFTARVINGSTTQGTYSQHQFYRIQDRRFSGNILMNIDGAAVGPTVTLSTTDDYFDAAMLSSGNEVAATIFVGGGAVRLDSVSNANLATGTVLKRFRDQYTHTTQFGQGWSPFTGYPRAVALHQDRSVYGGVKRFPNKVFLSRTGMHADFRGGALDDDALTLGLTDRDANLVVWIKSAGDLLVGAQEGEFKISGQPLTPTNVGADLQSTYGGRSVVPVQVGASIFFVTRHGDEMRRMEFRFENDKYVAPSLMDLSRHLFSGDAPIRELGYFRAPEQIVFALKDDGGLRALSYREENNLLAWSPWDGNSYDSVAVIAVGGEDRLWTVVSRNSERHISVMAPQSTDELMDAHKVYASPSTTLTGLSHLEGLEVQIVIDGTFVGTATVSGGQITSPKSGTRGVVGLSIPFTLTPQLIVEPPDATGSLAGRMRRINLMKIRFDSSFGGTLTDAEATHTILGIPRGSDIGETPARFTGWLEVAGIALIGNEPVVPIAHSTPQQFHIQAVNTKVDRYEN